MNKHGLTQDGKTCAEMVRMAGIHDEEGCEGKDGGEEALPRLKEGDVEKA